MMNRNVLRVAFAVAALAGAMGCGVASAQVSGTVRIDAPGASAKFTFGEKEIVAIREYYAVQPQAQPGGGKHKKEKPLPPGLQKKLDRGEPLPPGIAKRSLPADLDRRLAKLPAGYARYVVGSDVVLVDVKTNAVLDIVVGVAL